MVFLVAVLGDLEQHVMAVLWRAGASLSVRDVHERLHYARDVAYTTVLTVLDRLAKKGTVERTLDGRAWLYRSTKSCVDLHVEEILGLLGGCGQGHAERIMAEVTRTGNEHLFKLARVVHTVHHGIPDKAAAIAQGADEVALADLVLTDNDDALASLDIDVREVCEIAYFYS